MSITNAVSDRYRTATDRVAATDWTRLAAAVVAVQLATALWYIYVELLALEGENDVLEFGWGLTDPSDAVVVGLVIGTFLAPVLVATFLALSRILPIRRVYAQTAVPWLLFGPGLLLALIGYGLYDWGLELARAVFDAAPWMYAEWAGMWILLTGILATFAGGAFAFATGSVRPTDRQRRGLIVAVAVLVAVPMVAGAAFPIDDGDTDTSSLADDHEPTPDPADYDHENVSLGEEGSANHLLANETDAPPGIYPNYNITETHVGPEYFDLRTYEVNDDGEWATVDGQYYLTFEGPANRSFHREQVATVRTDWEEAPDGSFAGFGYGAPDSIEGELRMADVKSMWVTYDVIHENGEVHRYQVYLERNDV